MWWFAKPAPSGTSGSESFEAELSIEDDPPQPANGAPDQRRSSSPPKSTVDRLLEERILSGGSNFFISTEELRECAAESALGGRADSEEWVGGIRNYHDAVSEQLLAERRLRIAKIKQDLTGRIQKKTSWETDRTNQTALEESIRADEEKAKLLDHTISDLEHQLSRARAKVFDKFFDERRNQLTRKEREAHERISSVLASADQRYQMERSQWEQNAPEFERRAKVVEAEQELLKAKRGGVSARLAVLEEQYISRTTTGFLTWVGYVSIPAVGWLVATLLGHRLSGGEELLLPVLNALQGLFENQSGWSRFGAYVMLATLIAVLSAAVLLLSDLLLRWFDRGWSKQPKRQPRTANGDTLVSNRLVNLGRIRRDVYVKALALIPIVWISILVLSLLTAFGKTGGFDAAQISEFTSAATLTYVGSILYLLATSVSVVYVVKIIEPRWKRILELNQEARREAPRANVTLHLRAHWEIALVAASLFVVMILASVLTLDPDPNVQKAMAAYIFGGLALFALLSSICFAYGIVFRGVYKDQDVLDEEIDLKEIQIRSLRNAPIFEYTLEEINTQDEVQRLLRDHMRDIEQLDQMRYEFSFEQLFSMSPQRKFSDVFALLSHMRRLDARSRLSTLMKDSGPGPWDDEAADQITKRLSENRALRSEVDATMARKRADLQEVNKRIDAYDETAAARDIAVTQELLEGEESALRREQDLRDRRKDKEVLMFKSAFAFVRRSYGLDE
jgi:hypothetical protein